jgi:uncharacterized protein YcbK (DUF882 family)
MNQIAISDNFFLYEFESPDTKETKIDEKLIDKLESLRDRISKKLNRDVPLIINSGYRTSEYNKKVGGAENSFHMKGMAADIDVAGIARITIDEFAELAEEEGFEGIGKYNTFVHVDVRGSKARWDNRG